MGASTQIPASNKTPVHVGGRVIEIPLYLVFFNSESGIGLQN